MPQILLLGELFIKSTLICAEKFSGYGSMSDCTDLGKVSVGLWEKNCTWLSGRLYTMCD